MHKSLPTCTRNSIYLGPNGDMKSTIWGVSSDQEPIRATLSEQIEPRLDGPVHQPLSLRVQLLGCTGHRNRGMKYMCSWRLLCS